MTVLLFSSSRNYPLYENREFARKARSVPEVPEIASLFLDYSDVPRLQGYRLSRRDRCLRQQVRSRACE